MMRSPNSMEEKIDSKSFAQDPIEDETTVAAGNDDNLVNSSGHVQEVDRTFGIFSICAMGVLSDNAWGGGGGALVVSLYNGGGPGVLYGLIAALVFYCAIAAGLAELASAIPSSANVYTWAAVTAGPRYGRLVSFYAGWWNCIAWVFGVASVTLFAAQAAVAAYSLYHPDYIPQRWHYFIAYLVITLMDLSVVLFAQKLLARIAGVTGVLMILFWFVITMVCAIMPSQTGHGYASNSFVWTDFQNLTGWSSNGLVFVMGILNGAYTIGTPDGVCHLCEEVPNPKKSVPWGMMCQLITGFVTAFTFYLAVLYGVTDFNDVPNTPITALPLAAMFQQAVRSNSGTLALLLLFFLDFVLTIPAGYVTGGRMLWTLARDDAVPFSHVIRKVDAKWRNPFNAHLVGGCCSTILGALYVGNATAFTAFVSCFAIFTTWSYCAALLPHILSRRQYVFPKRGPFWMTAWIAYPVVGFACAYILIFNVLYMYMFPYVYPVTVTGMNYACVLSGGLTLLLTFWYAWKRGQGYVGPRVISDANDDVLAGIVGLSQREEEERRRRSAVSI